MTAERKYSQSATRQKSLFENKYAMDCGKPQKTEYTKLGNSAVRYKNDTLRVLRDFLQGEKAEKPADSHGITLAYSHNMSGEADFVCANIRKLVRYEGYRYSDIAVICAAPAKYRDAVRSAALRYEVPMFVDLPEPVSEKPLLRYLDCLLCAAEDPRGINIIRYIRSGLQEYLLIKRGKDRAADAEGSAYNGRICEPLGSEKQKMGQTVPPYYR